MTHTRKEQIGDCTLYLGDCLEVMPTLGKVDAVVTDPPYGINWKPRVNHQDQMWVDELNYEPRALLIGRYHIIWGGQYLANKLPIAAGWLTWCKRPAVGFFDDVRTYATTEVAWCDIGKTAFIIHVWDGGKRAGCADNRTFCHPSQKPVEVMEWCLRRIPSDAQIILDPFMGSGTTGVACAKLGRKFIGIEIDDGYFDIACKRIKEAYDQPDFFVAPPAPELVQAEMDVS